MSLSIRKDALDVIFDKWIISDIQKKVGDLDTIKLDKIADYCIKYSQKYTLWKIDRCIKNNLII